MYKALIFVLFAIIATATASDVSNTHPYNIQRITAASSQLTLDSELCKVCIDVADESINILLNLILDTGIIGTCGTLCQALAQKTGSQLIGTICNLACDAVGIAEFIHILENADIDPILYCEIAKMCAVNDHGDAHITQFSILPATGRRGTTFSIDLTYVSVNGTGTGELDIDIHCPDRIPLGAGFLLQAEKPGTFSQRITVKAEPDPQCDPTQEPCEEWLPGVYNVTVQVCNGECGSKHAHSAIYDTSRGSFTLTSS